MPWRMLSVSHKLAILEEAEKIGSIKITAHKHKLQKIQIMNWSVNNEKLIENASYPVRRKQSIDAKLIWIKKWNYRSLSGSMIREIMGFFVSTRIIITKLLQINPEVKGGCVNTICWWVYRFLLLRKLALSWPTRVSQHTPAEDEAVRESFEKSTMTCILMNLISRSLFVNIDETIIYFDTLYHTTVNVRGARTVSSVCWISPPLHLLDRSSTLHLFQAKSHIHFKMKKTSDTDDLSWVSLRHSQFVNKRQRARIRKSIFLFKYFSRKKNSLNVSHLFLKSGIKDIIKQCFFLLQKREKSKKPRIKSGEQETWEVMTILFSEYKLWVIPIHFMPKLLKTEAEYSATMIAVKKVFAKCLNLFLWLKK